MSHAWDEKNAILTYAVYLWLLDSIDDLCTVAMDFATHTDSSSQFKYVQILDTLSALPTSILQMQS